MSSKYDVFSLPAHSPAAKQARAAYDAYLERKAQKEKIAAEQERRRQEGEERKNLIANLETGMYLAVRHYAGQGLGHEYVVGRLIASNTRKGLVIELHT